MSGKPYGIGNKPFLFTFLLFTVMKKYSTFFAVVCAVWLLVAPSAPHAQRPFTSITINSVSGTTFCGGDPVSVTFTVAGAWVSNNAFTLQLSNDSGTFDQGFQNLGSIQDTAPGTLTIITSMPTNISSGTMRISRNITTHDTAIYIDTTIDSIVVEDTTFDTTEATHYRFRVIGAIEGYPYFIASADNGTDIWIGLAPYSWDAPALDEQTEGGMAWAVNETGVISIQPKTINGGVNYTGVYDSIYIDNGAGANPETLKMYNYNQFNQGIDYFDTITYSTPGPKNIILTSIAPGGCSISDTFPFIVYDCTSPTIPHDAIIISQNGSNGQNALTYWVNPGVSFGGGKNDTIFAEAGASIGGSNIAGDVIYLKPGASSTISYGGVVIYAPGASVDTYDPTKSSFTLECDSVSFDYTIAPPNAVMGINVNEGVVATNNTPTQIEISPNPTNGIVTLQNIPLGSNVMVMNVLGETVQTETTQGNTNLSLDLSNCAAGTYYIRIASGNSVTTKAIVKE
jgi:hypothetical protein